MVERNGSPIPPSTLGQDISDISWIAAGNTSKIPLGGFTRDLPSGSPSFAILLLAHFFFCP
jgi:hypothetical protein